MMLTIKSLFVFRSRQEGKSNWPPMIGFLMGYSPVIPIPESKWKDRYAPKTFYECPTYFYKSPSGYYPTYMQVKII